MNLHAVSKIAGVGAYLPDNVVFSDDLMDEINSLRFGTPINYLSSKIGIIERRVANANQSPSDLAIEASIQAMEQAGIQPQEIDLVLYCGIDRDWQEPATAHRVQSVLGCSRATCQDVTNACLGFMNGLAIADAFINSGAIETALICTGEKPSQIMAHTINGIKATSDKKTFRSSLGALTVGDAGGAMVVQKSLNDSGWQQFRCHSQGEYAKLCYYQHKGNGIEGQMLMKEINTQIIRLHQQMIDSTYQSLNWQPKDISTLYCHQTGAQPHQAMIKLAGVEPAKAPITYEKFGNLTSATLPVNMALNPAKKGTKALILGTGSGISICQAGLVF